MKTVILEGAGDTVDKHYFPALVPWINRGEIRVWVTDVVPEPWAIFKEDLKVPPEIFLYKRKGAEGRHQRDYEFLHNLTPAIVFVVTPDRYHCITAQQWSLSADRIVIDKAFAPSTEMIDDLLKAIKECSNAVQVEEKIKGFDHYRVAALPVKIQIKELISQIGGLTRIEFRMLEDRRVESHRDLPGMIEDFSPHLFALLDLLGDLGNLQVQDVFRSQYPDAWRPEDPERDTKETFAEIQFAFLTHYSESPIEGLAFLGKGIGTGDEKFLDLIGPRGKVRLDFRRTSPRDIVLYRRQGQEFQWLERVAYLYDGHQEMINRAVRGVLDEEECYFSIRKARKIITQVESVYQNSHPAKNNPILLKYQPGESAEVISERLKKEGGRER